MRVARQVAGATVLLAAAASSTPARADGASCADVRVAVKRSPERTTSAQLVEAIFAEVSPHASTPCDSEQARSVVSIAVDWGPGERARVQVDLSKQDAHYVVTREVDLTHVARDTLGLTLAIAADELLREARDRSAVDEPPPPPPSPPDSAAEAPPPLPPPAPPARDRWAFGSSAAVEWFSSGVALAGPDATLEWAILPRLELSASIGLRAAIAGRDDVARGMLTSAGAWLRWRLSGGRRAGTGVSAGLDALTLATPAGDLRATVAPGVLLSGWQSIARGCRVRVDAGGGAPMTALALPAGGAIDGLELRARASLLVDF